MTRLLISVRNEFEAALVCRHEVGIIDAKDPASGALGRVDNAALRKILQVVEIKRLLALRNSGGYLMGESHGKEKDNRISDEAFNHPTRFSFAGGELFDWIEKTEQLGEPDVIGNFDFAKIGLAGMASFNDWQDCWMTWANHLPAGVAPVGVAYVDSDRADSPPIETIIELMEGLGSFSSNVDSASEVGSAIDQVSRPTLLLDTFEKSSGSTFDLLGTEKVTLLVNRLRERNIGSVIAGSINVEQLSIAIDCQPDFVGVRGAVCKQGRSILCGEKLGVLVAKFNSANKRLRKAGAGE